MWALSTFGHGWGLDAASRLFRWAKSGGTWLSEAGGVEGMRRLELLLALGCGLLACAVLAALGRQVARLRPAPRRLVAEAAPWLAWALGTYAVWKVYIVYATELTHFVQYAIVGFLVALAWRRGRDPQAAFLLSAGLGLLDELWQHYLLPRDHAHAMQHWMDWSDLVLDALGATGGILPFVTLGRLRGDPLPDTRHRLRWTFGALAALLLPLLFLSPRAHSLLFGHYRYGSFWFEYDNDKPVHWPGPVDGIPLALGSLLLLGLLVEPRRRALGQGELALLLALVVVAVQPPSRKKGQPVHEDVPTAVARRSPEPPRIDGVLDDPAWARAERLGPFVNNRDGSPANAGETYARILWDRKRIYVAFEVEDRDLWARDLPRDHRDLPADEVVELFLDDGGDELTYFEVEVSPLGAVQDLFCFVPRAPIDFDTGSGFFALNAWDARGLEVAVAVDGQVDVVKSFWRPPADHGGDRGWTVELSLPWKAIAPYPDVSNAHRPVPPRPGDRWRIGLYRIERPRPAPGALADRARTLDADAAWQRAAATGLFADREALRKALGKAGFLRDDGGVLAWRLEQVLAAQRAEFQAWAPTHHASFHRPAWFGVLAFE
ncbi:MAG: hypothetical protein D6731_11865 [Planctomycetota bacterium]|nr:MAG: hypothetical protein D6731_11865 [Planctomycetota bacterium]